MAGRSGGGPGAGTGGPPDGSTGDSADGPPGRTGPAVPEHVAVPDDASGLELDLLAYRREQAARARSERTLRLFRTRRWHRYGLSGPLVVLVLLVVSVFGGLLALLIPTGNRLPAAARRPLQTAPARTGAVGGLLPEVLLRSATGRTPAVASRSLRPGVLVLLPPRCGCTDVLDRLSGQAHEFALRYALVSAGTSDPQLPGLLGDIRRGRAEPFLDSGGTLAGAYARRGLTLLLVRDDGVLTKVVHDPGRDDRLEPALRRLSGDAGS